MLQTILDESLFLNLYIARFISFSEIASKWRKFKDLETWDYNVHKISQHMAAKMLWSSLPDQVRVKIMKWFHTRILFKVSSNIASPSNFIQYRTISLNITLFTHFF